MHMPQYRPYRNCMKSAASSLSLFATNHNQNQNQNSDSDSDSNSNSNSNLRNRSKHLTIQGRKVLAGLTLPYLLFPSANGRYVHNNNKNKDPNQNQYMSNMYVANALDEPTPEFLELDRKKREFRARQMEIRKDWDVEMEKFLVMKDENQIIKQMETFTKIIRVAEGLPMGVSKKEMVSQMRRVKKAGKEQGYWTTEVEKAYQAYIRGVDYIQSPNTDRQ